LFSLSCCVGCRSRSSRSPRSSRLEIGGPEAVGWGDIGYAIRGVGPACEGHRAVACLRRSG